jgi:hypothetical protein
LFSLFTCSFYHVIFICELIIFWYALVIFFVASYNSLVISLYFKQYIYAWFGWRFILQSVNLSCVSSYTFCLCIWLYFIVNIYEFWSNYPNTAKVMSNFCIIYMTILTINQSMNQTSNPLFESQTIVHLFKSNDYYLTKREIFPVF